MPNAWNSAKMILEKKIHERVIQSLIPGEIVLRDPNTNRLDMFGKAVGSFGGAVAYFDIGTGSAIMLLGASVVYLASVWRSRVANTAQLKYTTQLLAITNSILGQELTVSTPLQDIENFICRHESRIDKLETILDRSRDTVQKTVMTICTS